LGLDRRRVLGSTANDTRRLRTAVGDQLGVASSSVEAWVIGEHGDDCVPLLDRVRVDGNPVVWSPIQAQAAEDFLSTGTSATSHSTPAAPPPGPPASGSPA
jgi:malate/lactate dehydrogenase